MKNLEWLYANDCYLNSAARLMAQVKGHATDSFTANEWLMAEHVAVSAKPLKMPTDGEWAAVVGAPKLQNSQSDVSKSEETDEIGASKREMRDFDAEHAEGRFTDFSRTSASPRQNDGMDSREKLEADVREWWRIAIPGVQETEVNCINYNKTLGWLDRQAAIAEREAFMRGRASLDDEFSECRAILEATKRAIAKAGCTWTEDDDGAVAVVFAPDMDKLKADLEAAHAKNRLLKAHIGKMQDGRHGWHIKAKELQEKVDELTAERDDLKEDNRRYEHDCELLWQEKRELTAQRDKLHEELRIEREAVEACDGCGKVDDLQAKLDALKRAVSDAGGMWMEEGGTVMAAFAPDVDELRAERNYWKDQVHRCVIASVEPGGYTAGVMGYPRDKDYIAPYLLVTDAIDSLKDFYADAKREVAKYQEVVDNQNEVIEDLKAERDQFEDYAYRVETERDKYREKFGKAMDFAGEIGRLAE